MAKKLINLLIEPSPEPIYYRRLKKLFPLISFLSLLLFTVLYLSSLLYLQINIKEYNSLKAKYTLLENKIAEKKSAESIYVSTIGILDTIKKILDKDSKIISSTFPTVFGLQQNGIQVNSTSVDNSGPVGITVSAESSDSLLSLYESLKELEVSSNFRQIQASGIIRENDGRYSLTVNFNAFPKKNET